MKWSRIKILAQKELAVYFNTPIAYITIILFVVINAWFYSQSLFLNNIASLDAFLNICPFVMMFFVPAVVMRLIAEDKRSGMIEIMLTLPLRDTEYILGKYIAGSVVSVLAILFTLVYVITTSFLGKLDFGVVVGAYVGLIFLALMYTAISLFASSISSNQVVAFLISFVIIFVLFLMGKILIILPPGILSIVEYLSTDYHLQNISKGVIDTRDIVYYLSFIFFFLYATYQVLVTRKYR